MLPAAAVAEECLCRLHSLAWGVRRTQASFMVRRGTRR